MAFISNNMFVVKYRKVWFALSAIMLAVSVWAMVAHDFNLSTDFKGGTLTEVSFEGNQPAKEQIEAVLERLNIGGYSVRPSGEDSFVIRTKELSDVEREKFAETLLGISSTRFTVERQSTIGPIAGAELQGKALKAIAVVVMMIVLFITFAFRKVSVPVSSWKYGLATIIALAHDVIIPTGIFILMSEEIDLLFVTGLLAILGYSVHDSIVVFDRVRENISLNQENNSKEDFEITVGKSVNQTFARSINTSVTIFITLIALYLFGPKATQTFALLLTIGVIIGTYSSIFVASPLLVTFYKLQKKDR